MDAWPQGRASTHLTLNFTPGGSINLVMSVEQVLARIAQIETALSTPDAAAAASLATPATALSSNTPASSATSTTAASSSPSSSANFAAALDSALTPEAGATAAILGGNGSSGASSDTATALASPLPSLLSADPNLANATGSGIGGAASSATTPLSLQSLLSADPNLISSDANLAAAIDPAAASANATTAGAGNQTIVAIARSQLGVSESPPGSNDSPIIAQYRTATAGAQAGEPWCAYFASWVARQAGEPLGAQGQGFGAVADIWSWAQQTGRAVTNGPGVVPQPGDLIVFGDHHVGIVDQVLPNGDIETVEGNYENAVTQVVRSPTEATGYVRMS